MADQNTVPLSIISAAAMNSFGAYATIAVGNSVLRQNVQPGHASYWFVVLDRSNLNVVYNQLQTAPDQAPGLGAYNDTNHILIVATLGLGLDRQPQGALFKFLDVNGAGMQLRRIEQLATQIGCGSLGTFGYALVGLLGNQNQPGFEASSVAASPTGPIITVQLLPVTVQGQTLYTPIQLSDA